MRGIALFEVMAINVTTEFRVSIFAPVIMLTDPLNAIVITSGNASGCMSLSSLVTGFADFVDPIARQQSGSDGAFPRGVFWWAPRIRCAACGAAVI
jgi:hypothetical protein